MFTAYYAVPVVLLFVSIFVFKAVFNALKARRSKRAGIEKFEEHDSSTIPRPNDRGVQLLYEIRGMMLNHQNEIDKRLEALSDKKETGIVLDKMSELESVLKGEDRSMSGKSDHVEAEGREEKDEQDRTTKKRDKKLESQKKGSKSKASNVAKAVRKKDEQLVDDTTEDEASHLESSENGGGDVDDTEDAEANEDGNGDILEPFVEGMQYCNSATNCYEL